MSRILFNACRRCGGSVDNSDLTEPFCVTCGHRPPGQPPARRQSRYYIHLIAGGSSMRSSGERRNQGQPLPHKWYKAECQEIIKGSQPNIVFEWRMASCPVCLGETVTQREERFTTAMLTKGMTGSAGFIRTPPSG